MKKYILVIVFLVKAITALNASEYFNLNTDLFDTKKVKHFRSFMKLKTDDEGGIKKQILITAGVAFNFSDFNFKRRYDDGGFSTVSTFYSLSSKSSPFYNLVVDYGLFEKISLGLAAGYQTTVVDWGRTGYYDNYNFVADTSNGSDTWTRIHVALRGDYRIIAKKNLGLYAGLRLGYNYYSVKSNATATNPDYLTKLNMHPLPVSVQAHIGFSYWLNGIVGLNTEFGVGIGGPYILGVGITGKFN